MNEQLYPHKSVNSKDDSRWLQKRITTPSLRSHRDMMLSNKSASEQKVQFWLNRSQISADSQFSPYVDTILYALPFYKYLLGGHKWWLLLRAQKGRTVWEIENVAVTFKSDTLQHFISIKRCPCQKKMRYEAVRKLPSRNMRKTFLVFDTASERLMTAFVCTRRNIHNLKIAS